MKKAIETQILLYILLALTGLVLFREAALDAMKARGYFAIGGEWFLLGLPLWYWLIESSICDFVNELKKGEPRR